MLHQQDRPPQEVVSAELMAQSESPEPQELVLYQKLFAQTLDGLTRLRTLLARNETTQAAAYADRLQAQLEDRLLIFRADHLQTLSDGDRALYHVPCNDSTTG